MKYIIKKIKKFTVLFLIFAIIFVRVLPVSAIEIPTAPITPTAPAVEQNAPQTPTAPVAPFVSTINNPDASNNSSPADDQNLSSNTHPQNQDAQTSQDTSSNPTSNESVNSNTQSQTTETANGDSQQPDNLTGTTSNGNSNDTTIQTGNATNGAFIITTGNNNMSSNTDQTQNNINASSSENGANSTNNSNVNDSSASITTQNNSVEVANNLEQTITTGQNSASLNTGGDSTIKTGDANTTGTLITSANTNLDGVMVSEFNVADDYNGDIILDFAANCISDCSNADISVQNTNNGSDSQNSTSIENISDNTTFQNNDGTVENDMVLKSDSGKNIANKNTNGDTYIETGDANISASALTFLNNNIAGKIIIGIVNIFGNLVGDIILPEGTLQSNQDIINASNTNNGEGSKTSANITNTTSENTFQNNDATIENNLTFYALTGDNQVSKNTGGDFYINTGEASVETKTVNIANSNTDGGNIWLVIVNEAGKWIGKILGAPEGSSIASGNMQFSVDEQGSVTATNSENGENSNNSSNISNSSEKTATQTNEGKIVNNLNFYANTGGNQANYNTGGDSVIKTGDAKIIANIINFVNNNITGNGNLVVTVVNVFGSWIGDLLPPGTKKENNNQQESASSNKTTGEMPSSQSNESSNPVNNTQNNKSETTNITAAQNTSQIIDNSNNSKASNYSRKSSYENNQNNNYKQGSLESIVAGIKTNNENVKGNIENSVNFVKNKAKQASILRINFAWLILALPPISLIILIRKSQSKLAKERRGKIYA